MVKVTALKYAAIGMATLGMAGIAAASTVTVSDTGSHSNQTTTIKNTNKSSVDNDNHVMVGNLNSQGAESGRVDARDNTTVSGAVGSGDAMNSNSSSTTVAVTNGGSGTGAVFGGPANDSVSYDTTGSHSNQTTTITNENTMTVNNDNHVGIMNLNMQRAQSGNVSVSDNTTVGGVSSGDASNSNTTTTSVSIHN